MANAFRVQGTVDCPVCGGSLVKMFSNVTKPQTGQSTVH